MRNISKSFGHINFYADLGIDLGWHKIQSVCHVGIKHPRAPPGIKRRVRHCICSLLKGSTLVRTANIHLAVALHRHFVQALISLDMLELTKRKFEANIAPC